MFYKLSDGTRVRTTRDGDVVEFETYRYTPEKEVVSVERLVGEEADLRVAVLSVLDGMRFGEQYGGRPRVTVSSDTHITARQIRHGDVFTLHGHTRIADGPAWRLRGTQDVHIRFAGGGDATIPADRPLTVRRTVSQACATA